MAHMIDTMAYAGELPWHKLGHRVGDNEVVAAEIMKGAKMGWGVTREDLYVRDLTDAAKTVLVPGQKAIRRDDNGLVLSIMSDSYRPVQNTERFTFFDEVVGAGQAIYHTAMSLDEGRKAAILAKIPKDLVVAGQEIEQYLLLADSYDGSIAFTMAFTPIRVVCKNTLDAALQGARGKSFKLRHTLNVANKVEAAKAALGFAVKASGAFEQEAQRLAATRFSETQMKALAETLFPTPADGEVSPQTTTARDLLVNLFENGQGHEPIRGTAWAAYNAVAEFTDHYRGTRKTNGKSEDEARTLSVLFGASKTMKQNAVQAIYQMVA